MVACYEQQVHRRGPRGGLLAAIRGHGIVLATFFALSISACSAEDLAPCVDTARARVISFAPVAVWGRLVLWGSMCLFAIAHVGALNARALLFSSLSVSKRTFGAESVQLFSGLKTVLGMPGFEPSCNMDRPLSCVLDRGITHCFFQRPMGHGSIVVYMHEHMCMCDTMLCLHLHPLKGIGNWADKKKNYEPTHNVLAILKM